MIPPTDIEGILTRFRDWLGQAGAAATADAQPATSSVEPPAADAVGLWEVVCEFTALRQEVKLQTKSSRALEEQAGAAVQALHEALARLRQIEADQSRAAEQAAAPLVEAMADLDEALQRGQTALESARLRLMDLWTIDLPRQLGAVAAAQSGWRRWLCRGWHRAVGKLVQETADKQRQVVGSLADGYLLVRGRLERAMAREGLERIRCLGQPVDPHAMTVVEASEMPGQPAGMVLEELRPGYCWKGRVLRFAEVRASTQYRE